MSVKVIDIVQVLVDRIHRNGYEQRALEDDIYAEKEKLAAAEKEGDHWRQARQNAMQAGELMQAEIERLRTEVETLKNRQAAVQRIIDVIDQLSVVSAGDPDGCVEAIGQIRKYFDPNEYPVLKGGE